MTLCRWMRWKSYYTTTTFTDDELAALYALDDVPYSCLKTCEAWGPDDGLAAPERCQPGRRCFVPSPKHVAAVATGPASGSRSG